MRVLIACEESQVVCKAFRERGHEAYSCDILPTSGDHPEWHIQTNVLYMMHEPIWFSESKKWDLLIAFPPCTYVCFAGIRWNVGNPERTQKTSDSIEFFKRLYYCGIQKVAIENPVGVIPRHTGIKWTQMIHPWEHGHGEQKKTCLWLKNLPSLIPTDIVEGREQRIFKMGPSTTRSTDRSKTYPGIAKAMAEQWG